MRTRFHVLRKGGSCGEFVWQGCVPLRYAALRTSEPPSKQQPRRGVGMSFQSVGFPAISNESFPCKLSRTSSLPASILRSHMGNQRVCTKLCLPGSLMSRGQGALVLRMASRWTEKACRSNCVTVHRSSPDE